MKGTTPFAGAAVAALAVTGLASAGTIVFDQIGDNGGGDLSGGISNSQYFLDAGFDIYNVGALDDFTLDSDWKLTSVEAVISGFNGYAGIAPIVGFQVNIYSDPTMAALNLAGDVFSADFATFDSNINIDAVNDIAQFDVNVDLTAGTYYLSVITSQEFFVNGQSGIAQSNLGDGVYWFANPNGGFNFADNLLESKGNLAYRLQAIPAPGSLALLGIAGLVATRRRRR